MSNRKLNNETKPENVGNTTGEPAKEPTEKKGFIRSVSDRCQKTVIRIRSSKTGRIVIRCTKAAAIGLGLYGAYRFGQKSTRKPEITITAGEGEVIIKEEEPITEEEPTEEESMNQEQE